MSNERQAQKNHYNHPEENELDLDATIWICELQRMQHDLTAGTQEPKLLHVPASYDEHFWPPDPDDNYEVAARENVCLP